MLYLQTGAMSNVTLHFDRVFLQDYRNYTFIVDNGVGRAEKMVAFVEGEGVTNKGWNNG